MHHPSHHDRWPRAARRWRARGLWLSVVGVGLAGLSACGRSGPADPRGLHRGDPIGVSVVGVHDGDSLTGLTADRQQIKIRLDGIDAPELGQPFGKAAKRALSEKIFGRQVVVVVKGHDLYGRLVGKVTLEGRDVGRELVREGFAWRDPRFDHDAALAGLEQSARRAKAGLWADRSPTAPWDHRKARAGKGGT
ncbi:MAG: thermonuclease family protein, partial [Planctomycetaceae bacterium]